MIDNLDCAGKILDLKKTVIMGVLNVTPDSFSDGGFYFDKNNALEQAQKMVDEGADIIDIGGESTRPNAQPVELTEEIRRVIPVIELLSKKLTVPISIDTSKAKVMIEAFHAGAGLINDVRALQNEGALSAASETGLPVCLMHMQGDPRTMQSKANYDNVVDDIKHFFISRLKVCEQMGIDKSKIILDPGFGFGKNLEHNVHLLNNLNYLNDLGLPILAGLSRKSLIGHLLGLDVNDREYASIALALAALQNGAKIVRVHDVKGTHDAIRMFEAIKSFELQKNNI